MYRPQYLERKYEVTSIYADSNTVPYLTIRTPIKGSAYKRKENNEVKKLYGKKKPR
jgi:hypothetical protein|nr:MAG TPA: hypothetical protein [Caudoviricetes sp.]